MPAAVPAAARNENASRNTVAITDGTDPMCTAMTISPPVSYSATLSGASFSAARPMDLMPPMITAQVSTATTQPVMNAVRSTRPRNGSVTVPDGSSWLTATAIEFGCVNGVVVNAATPATTAYASAS